MDPGTQPPRSMCRGAFSRSRASALPRSPSRAPVARQKLRSPRNHVAFPSRLVTVTTGGPPPPPKSNLPSYMDPSRSSPIELECRPENELEPRDRIVIGDRHGLVSDASTTIGCVAFPSMPH